MAELILANKNLKENNYDVYIIAEIGQNHQGDLATAKQMIFKAKQAGCDCVKFQKSDLNSKFTTAALNRAYVNENSWGQTYGEHKRYLEFSNDQYLDLQAYATELEIDFTASAMDEISLQFVHSLNPPFIKIGSGDSNNFPMLKKAAQFGTPLVISTGMQTMETIDEIVNIMKKSKKTNFALLYCVSSYPTAAENCNLLMIKELKQRFSAIIGYSGHEEDIFISQAAVLLGARIIERHFTLDKRQKGSDHKCSLDPAELQQLVVNIRQYQQQQLVGKVDDIKQIIQIIGNEKRVALELALKLNKKSIMDCEISCKTKLGKSLVAGKLLKKGSQLEEEDIMIKVSDPNGIPAEKYFQVLGKTLKVNLDKDQPLTYEILN